MFVRCLRYLMLSLSLSWLFPGLGETAEGRFEITADYRYASQASEPIAEAKALACREAWRLAVINSPLYREHTASVVDSPLLRNLAYTLATGYVEDQQILEQTVQGRTISCRVHGYLPAEESARVIRMQLAGSNPANTDQNRALRIVNTAEEGGYLVIQFQALKRLDWPSTAYQGSLREIADIMVDFYDETGMLIRTERHPAIRADSNHNVLNPGMLGILKVPKPLGMATYRVWLVK